MNEYAIVPATDAHVLQVAADMRQADVDEVWAASRRLPKEALEYSMLVSRDTKAGLVNGKAVCMFGIGIAGTTLTPRACPWLLGSNELPKHARTFLRMSREYVNGVKLQHEYMTNFVDARNAISIRWLRWLGFDIKDAIPFGPDGIPFHPFEMRRDDNV